MNWNHAECLCMLCLGQVPWAACSCKRNDVGRSHGSMVCEHMQGNIERTKPIEFLAI